MIGIWSGSNTPVMQGRHIRAQNESERAASSPGRRAVWAVHVLSYVFFLVAVGRVTAARTHVFL